MDNTDLTKVELIELIDRQVTLQQQSQYINQQQQLVGNEILERRKKHLESKEKHKLT